jgi:hypothetical protein
MLQKTPPISFPGELPPVGPRTISLWSQLRLSYETYPWLRLLCWVGLGLVGLLLLVLPGSFPPPVLMDVWHMLKAFPTLWQQQGIIVIFTLLWNSLLMLLYLLLWGGLFFGSRQLGRYTWRLIRIRAMVANRWQPSSALRGPPTCSRTTDTANHNAANIPQPGAPVYATLSTTGPPQTICQRVNHRATLRARFQRQFSYR